ncbi:MAG: hypothetical protein RL301_465 [Actinomycetota bacterium]|jgi:ZIP family zinc transporter
MALLFAVITVIATAAGGTLAIRSKDRFHLVLGLSAGLLLGLVTLELIPEVFTENQAEFAGVRVVSIALVAGFLALHILERTFGAHEPADSDYGHDHSHSHGNIAGGIGAVALAGHIFIDGVALGLAFQINNKIGYAVFFALLVHAFSDGLNTVSMLQKTGNWRAKAKWLLGVDAVMRISGAAVGTYIAISDSLLTIYLAVFSGIIIYLATSHILPEAHSRHPSRVTLFSTVAGVLIMWGVITVL